MSQPSASTWSAGAATTEAQRRTAIYLLGIDVGTGGTRALVVDAAGKVVGAASAEHQPFASAHTGWAEQDPNDWWKAARAAIPRALAAAGVSGTDIKAIGLTGQMHGAVLLDDADGVLRPALIWCDQRSEPQARALTERVGALRLIELTCNPALTNFTLTKILWVRDNEPRLAERIRHIMLPKDYVRLRLTGEHATDVADASGTLLFDVARRRWSHAMAEAAGLDASVLPHCYESQEISGTVTAAAAAETGLAAGTPVVAGAGDQAAGAVGLGIVEPGAASATIGTSGVVFAATSSPAMDPEGRLHTFCHAIPQRWHVMGVTQAAGLSLRWFRDTFGAGGDDGRDPYDRISEEAATAPAGCDGVLWAPYLMGERTPHLDPHARGALVGLAANHRRGHVIRAIMEGVAFSLRDTFTLFEEMRLPIGNVRLGGGGARSPLWRQIQADVYGRPVEIPVAEEGAAFGAALLAGVGAGAWKTVDDACRAAVHVMARMEPDALNTALMEQHYSNYRRLYPALRQVYSAPATAGR